jgi:alpha-tubulin suppressor-like RCC1 family protein
MHTTRREILLVCAAALLALAAIGVRTAEAATAGPGSVLAFGANASGQLGSTATATPNPTPAVVEIPGQVGPVTQLAVGNAHSLLVTASGQLFAFGSNQFGQLGSAANAGTTTPNPTPALVGLPGAIGPVTRVAAGAQYSLALTASGQLYAFGANRFGQLGNPANTATSNPNPTPTQVVLPGQVGTIVQFGAGDSHTFALTSSGQLYTFGFNAYGVLGRPQNNDPNPTPMVVQLPFAAGPITQVSAGERFTLALTASGELFAWGDDEFGEVGVPDNGESRPPGVVAIPGRIGAVTRIVAGSLHSFILTASDQLYVFGSNEEGQLGFPLASIANSPAPLTVGLPGQAGTVTSLAAALWHSLVVTSSGQLYAWGEDFAGQLGSVPPVAAPFEKPAPALVALPPGTTIDTVARGSEAAFTLALVSDLAITSDALPPARQGAPYAGEVTSQGGTAPLRWTGDRLPAGLAIDPGTGLVSGTPTVSGSFAPTIAVVDAYGIRTSRTLVLDLAPAPSEPAPAAAAPANAASIPPPATRAPRLSGLAQSATRWARGNRAASLSIGTAARLRRTGGHVVGTAFGFTLDQAARVAFTFRRTSSGRRVGSGCAARTSRNASRPACTRSQAVGTLAVQAGAGRSTLHFEGTISRHLRLSPGTYDVAVRATNAQGMASGVRELQLVVVAG